MFHSKPTILGYPHGENPPVSMGLVRGPAKSIIPTTQQINRLGRLGLRWFLSWDEGLQQGVFFSVKGMKRAKKLGGKSGETLGKMEFKAKNTWKTSWGDHWYNWKRDAFDLELYTLYLNVWEMPDLKQQTVRCRFINRLQFLKVTFKNPTVIHRSLASS